MDKVRVSFVAVPLVFVLALVAVRSEGNRKFLETLLGNRVSSFSQDELDQETVEQMWIRCWKKIEYISKTIPDFRLNHPYEIEKAITNLPSKAQESVLDCLTERNLLLATANHDSLSTTFLDKFLDFFSGFSNVPRRNLISRKKPQSTDLPSREKHPHQPHNPQTTVLPLLKKHPRQYPNQPTADLPLRKKHHRQHHSTQTPNLPLHKKHHRLHQNPELPLRKKHPRQHQNPKSPDLPLRKKHPPHHHEPKTNTLAIPKLPPRHRPHQKANSPKTSTLSLSALLASTARPLLLEPSRTPTPAPTPANVPAPAPIHISPEPSAPSSRFDTSPPPLVAKPAPPKDALRTSPLEREDTCRYIIMAAVASGVAVLAVVAFLFVCCLKRGGNKVDPKDGQKDENPLLNLCLSSMSASTDKTKTEENPKEKILKTTTLMNNSTSSSDSLSSSPQAANNNTLPAVPPPPGKKAPPPPPKKAAAPSPPPPPKGVKPPPPPFSKALPRKQGKSSLGGADDGNGGSDSHKAKLKPFFWDKVSPDQSMVWQELKAGSFQVNEEMMETLFGYTVAEMTKHDERKGSSPPQYITIIDPKKSQNLSILLKALNVTTEEVCDALKEGTELPSELTQTLLKMGPTTEEELKLRLYNGELSMLGPAERFLKSVVEIPFAFKRMESLLFISSVEEEISSINGSFKTLEVACTELKNSRLFLKLLEAVLKTGNRMNDGTYRGDAQAFKLDILLKLSDVKGTDGKTTLLHFVVQEITRSEGVRAARTLRESQSISSIKSDDLNDENTPDSPEYYRTLGLNVVSGLTNDLENVKKSAVIDGDAVTNTVYKLGFSLGKIKSFLENEIMGLEEESGFKKRVDDFVSRTEEEIERLVGEEKRIMEMVKGTVDYFYRKGAKNEGLRLFVIVRDFLVILDRVCKEVRSKEAKTPERARRREALTPPTSSDSVDIRQKLFPAITANRRDDSSSDDESFSP